MGADYERVRTEIGDGSSKEQLVMTRLTRLQTKGSRGHMHKNRVSGSYQLFFFVLMPPCGRLHIPLLPLSRTHCSRLLLQLLCLKCRPSNESTNSKHGYSNLTLPRQDACKQESTNRLRVSSKQEETPNSYVK